MTEFSFIINQMYTVPAQNEPNYVVQVNYTYKGVDGEFSSEISNSLFYNVVEENNFIPFEDLTKEIVTSWIVASLGEDGIKNYQDCINDQIAMLINPPVTPTAQPLPFQN
jgi:hypothetical protein